MNNKSLYNQLELAQPPMTAYEFAVQKDDLAIECALNKASLYVIARRPIITFENVMVDPEADQLAFEVHQKNNAIILYVKLSLVQKSMGLKEDDDIHIGFRFLDPTRKQKELPYNNIHGFTFSKLIQEDKQEFLTWFTPERLLNGYWRGYFTCEISGDFRSFTRYKVQYVGKATRQSILKRLKGHSTLQDILSMESPVTDKQLPANEIVILPFQFKGNYQMQSFDEDSDMASMIAAFRGDDYPSQETIFLDAEKALVKAMQPHYNKELFNNYPISKDGLHKNKYHAITYTFTDPITLLYDEGQIRGGLSFFGGDAIQIINGENFRLINQ